MKAPDGEVVMGEVIQNQKTTTSDMRLAYLDTEMEDDEARSEATIRFTVQNISSLKGEVYSPLCYVRNLPWSIVAKPSNDGQQLGLYLEGTVKSGPSSWSCYVNAEFRLMSHKPKTKPFSAKYSRRILFNSSFGAESWGFRHFMVWNDVLDPEKGYIKNDSITVEVHFTAEVPHGVSWYSEKLPGYEDPLKMELYYRKNTNVFCTKPVNETQECYFKDGDKLSVFCEQKQNNSLRLYKCSNGTKGNEDLSYCRATRYYNVSNFYQDLRLSKEDDNTIVICELSDNNNITQRKRLQTKLVLQPDDDDNQTTKIQKPQPITTISSELMTECRDSSDESCPLKMRLHYRKITNVNCTKPVNATRECYFKDGDKLSVYCGRNYNNYKLRIYTCRNGTKRDEDLSECAATPYYYNFRFLTQDLHLSKENDHTLVICELFNYGNTKGRKRLETMLVLQPDEPPTIIINDIHFNKSLAKPNIYEGKIGDKPKIVCKKNEDYGTLQWDICKNSTKEPPCLTQKNNGNEIMDILELTQKRNGTEIKCVYNNVNQKNTTTSVIFNLQPDSKASPYKMKLYYTNNAKVNCTKPVNGECYLKDGDRLWVECEQDQSNKLQLRMYTCSNGTKKDDDLSKCEATEYRNISELTTYLRLSKEDDNTFVICEFTDNIKESKRLQTKLVLQPNDRDNRATKTLGPDAITTKSSKSMTIVENWAYWITRTHT